MAGRQPYETVSISYEECRLVRGEKFGSAYDVSIPSSGTIYIKVTSQDKMIEIFERGFNIVTSSIQGIDVEAKLYEDSPDWIGGTEIDVFCDNREYCNTNEFQLFAGVSGGTLGTELNNRGSKIVTSLQQVSFAIRDSDRYRMKKNGTNVLEITNNGNAAVDLRYLLEWFEVRG